MTGVGRGEGVVTTHRARLQRTLRLLHAAVLALFAVALAGSLTRGESTAYVVAHLVLVAGCLLAAALTLVRGERAEHLLLVGPLAALTVLPPFDGVGDVSSGLLVNAVLLNAVRTLSPPLCAAVFAATVGAHAALRGILADGLTVAELADPYLLSVTNVAVAGIIVASLERSTSEIDTAAEQSASRALALVRRESADRAVDGARRVLHDDILTALRAVADGRPDDRFRDGCRDAVASFERIDAGHEAPVQDLSVAALVRDTVARSPVPVQVDGPAPDGDDAPEGVAEPGSVVLAPDVRLATARALLETLRNVERHAGGGPARLGVRATATTLTLWVEDDGPGFAAGDVEGFGLTESVRRPLESLGGSVRIGARGPGARVTLTVPRPDPTADALSGAERAAGGPSVGDTFRSVLGAGAARRLAVTGMLPLVAFWTFVAVTEIPVSATPIAQAGVLVALLVVVALVWARLVSGEPSRRWVLAVGGALVALQVAGLALIPPGGMLDLRSWPIGFVAVPQIILCFLLPVRWGLGLVASQVAVVLGAALVEPALAGGALPVNSLNAVTTPALITTLLGVRLRRNAAAAEAERKRADEAAAALVRRQVHSEASSQHLDHTRQVIVPWLRRLAGQSTAVTTEQREDARLLALEARDDLHVPGFHTPDLRRAVTDFRRRGGHVDVRPGFDDAEQRRDAADRLAQLLPVLAEPCRITLTSYDGEAGVRTVVTPPPPPDVGEALAVSGQVDVMVDDYVMVMTLSSPGAAEQERESA